MIGCIVQARMGSVRLPGKVMLKVDENNTVLDYVLTQIKSSKLLKTIIIATTTLDEDEKIISHIKNLNMKIFRGNSNDVLDRYFQCAKLFSLNIIVRNNFR